jgi:hypothetical protein
LGLGASARVSSGFVADDGGGGGVSWEISGGSEAGIGSAGAFACGGSCGCFLPHPSPDSRTKATVNQTTWRPKFIITWDCASLEQPKRHMSFVAQTLLPS